MRGRAPILLAAALLFATGCGKPGQGAPAPATEVLVAAAASLREVLLATQPAFEAAHPGARLAFSFDASSTLARQIAEGGRFEVFLSADRETLDRVRADIDPATILPFLGNRLALVARAGLEGPASAPAALPHRGGSVALAGPEVPAGRYARSWLEKNGLLAGLGTRIVKAASVRAALGLVESGAADYAFVYATEAAAAKSARLVWAATDAQGSSIVYVGAALARAGPDARAYLRWLGEEAFAGAAAKMGFTRPPP